MPRPPYPSKKRQWVDIPELKKRLGGAYPIKVDPSFLKLTKVSKNEKTQSNTPSVGNIPY